MTPIGAVDDAGAHGLAMIEYTSFHHDGRRRFDGSVDNFTDVFVLLKSGVQGTRPENMAPKMENSSVII